MSTKRKPRSSSAFACVTRETINHVLEHYDKLDKDIRAELPLKRIWIVTEAGE